MENNLSEQLFRRFHHASKHLRERERSRTTVELQRGQGRLLHILKHHDGISQKELAEFLGIKAASLR